MRIIGGKFGGLKIHPPSVMPFTRPTTDIAKEALFNIITHHWEVVGASVLDLFSGTGAIAYEFLSRGASHATLIEKDMKMQHFIQSRIRTLGFTANAVVYQRDVFSFLSTCTQSFSFIFAGPPYQLTQIERLPEMIFNRNILAKEGCFILEHTTRDNFQKHPFLSQERKYGTTIFSIFEYPEN